METIAAKITSKLLTEMDGLIKEGWYANRSEVIRDAIRNWKGSTHRVHFFKCSLGSTHRVQL